VTLGVAVSQAGLQQFIELSASPRTAPHGERPLPPEIGMQEWSGSLIEELLGEAPAEQQWRTFLVGLTASDVESCEDLGRQLRQFGRLMLPADQVIVLTDKASADAVNGFLRIERVTVQRQVAYPDGEWPPVRVADGTRPVSPFVAMLNSDGTIEHGVSYIDRWIGVRGASFADILLNRDG
jgi:hypothetical protein